MRRCLLACIAFLVVASGCRCSGRPAVRDLSQIGAPAVGVGSVQRLPPAPAQPDLERFSAIGRLSARGSERVTIQPKSGRSVVLDIGSRTSITSGGRVIDVLSLPEGAEVRASWTERKNARIADHIDVLDARPTRVAPPVGRRPSR